MNRKLRVFMLSLAVVMFAAASVFASVLADDVTVDVEINEVENYTSETLTEGYNYKTGYIISLPAWEGEEPDTRKLGNVSWDVYPMNGVDNWLKWHVVTGNNTSTLYLEGRLPEYSESDGANDHYFYVAAHVSADIVNDDYDEEVPGSQQYLSADVIFFAGTEVPAGQSEDDPRQWIIIGPDAADETSVDVYPDLVTVDDSGANGDMTVARKDKYSVTITFPRTTAITISTETGDDDKEYDVVTSGEVFVNAQLAYTAPDTSVPVEDRDPEIDPDALSLPSWLAYEVVDTQVEGAYEEDDDGKLKYTEDPDADKYVKILRIFYSSDVEPADETPASVRIKVEPAYTAAITDDRDHETYPDTSTTALAEKYSNGATIGWDVTYKAIPPVTLDKTEAVLPVKYGASENLVVNYTEQHPADGGIKFVPDLSGKVTLTATPAKASTEVPSGTITITATPVTLADAVYSTDMIVTDTNGLTATMRLNISVDVPAISLSANTLNLTATYGGTADATIDYTGPKPVGYTFSKSGTSPNAGFGLKLTSDDTKIFIVISPTISADWSGTLTILDEYKKSADVALTLKSVVTGEIVVVPSGDIPADIVINAGKTASYTLNAGNTYNAVKWLVSGTDLPDGMITPMSDEGSAFKFVINALSGYAGNYSATITATDESGRPAGSYTFSWTIRPPIALSGDFSVKPLVVEWGKSADTEIQFTDGVLTSGNFWSMSPDISADVSIDVSYTFANEGATDGKFIVTATPITPASKDYTTTLYFCDSFDNIVSAELAVKVTLPEPFTATVSPDVHSDNPVILKVGESTDVVFTATGFAGNVEWLFILSSDALKFEQRTEEAYTTKYNQVAVYTVTALKETGSAVLNTIVASDDAGRSSNLDNLYVLVPALLAVEPSVQTVEVTAGGASKTVSFTASGDEAVGVTWTVGTTPAGVTIESDGSGKFTVTADSSAAVAINTVTVTAANANGKTAEAGLVISVLAPTAITFSGDKIPESGLITYGGASTYTFTADATDSAKWTITGENIADIIAPLTDTGSTFTFTVNPTSAVPGTYTATVRFDDETTGKSGSYTFNVIVKSHIAIIYDTDTISVDYGSSADLTVDYKYQDVDSVVFIPDISADVKLNYDIILDNGTTPGGKIVVTAEPVAPYIKLYSTDMIVTGADGYSDTLTIFISVDMKAIAVSPESAPVSVKVGESKDVSFTASNNSGAVSWEIGDIPAGVTVVGDGSGKFTVTGGTAGTYSVKVTATDEAGRSATATISLTVENRPIPGTFTVSPATENVALQPGESADVKFTADSNTGRVTWTLGTIPAGITVAPASGTTAARDNTVMVYTVTAASSATRGSYTVTVNAVDSADHKATSEIKITVTSKDIPGTFAVTPVAPATTVKPGESADVRFTASNNTGNVTWTPGTIPAGITVAPTPGAADNTVMVYTVTAASSATPGNYTVTVTAKDTKSGKTATATLTITVSGPITVTPSEKTVNVTVGSPVSVTLTAAGGTGAVSWSATGLPAGVSINSSTGAITGTPTTAGEYTVTVSVKDAEGKTGAVSISITVTPVPVPFTVTPSTKTVTVTIGSAVNVTFTKTGGTGAVSWSATGLPEGVSINSSTGAITGTPKTSGSYNVTVTAKDTAGKTATATISITVTAPDDFTVTPSIETVTVTRGSAVNVTFTKTGGTGAVSWLATGLPEGVSINTSTGAITGTPTTAGEYTVTVTAKDTAGKTATATITIKVKAEPEPGEVTPGPHTEETKQLISDLKDKGSLKSDDSVSDNSLSYPTLSQTAKTLSRTGTTTVGKRDTINPIDIKLGFDVDIWRVYINNVLVAWAYSPGVKADEFVAADKSSNGVEILPSSKKEATILLDAAEMTAGTNKLVVGFVPSANEPSQEIGQTTLATLEVTPTPASGDVKGISSSSGGCSAGLGALVSAIAAAFFISKKRS